jgi:hypothetical protein
MEDSLMSSEKKHRKEKEFENMYCSPAMSIWMQTGRTESCYKQTEKQE